MPTVQETVSNLKQVSDDAVGLILMASKDYQETIPNVKASIQNAADATSRPVSFLMGWAKKRQRCLFLQALTTKSQALFLETLVDSFDLNSGKKCPEQD